MIRTIPYHYFRFRYRLLQLAKEYDEEGGGGDKFRCRVVFHDAVKARTAAWSALRLCNKLYPWRCEPGATYWTNLEARKLNEKAIDHQPTR